mmetsp:Transcript_30/g.102  ORF Transcript_30/g.102 Transcript_30/m.102 type:complete len:493 (-) Transcript_30:197-1675(-)
MEVLSAAPQRGRRGLRHRRERDLPRDARPGRARSDGVGRVGGRRARGRGLRRDVLPRGPRILPREGGEWLRVHAVRVLPAVHGRDLRGRGILRCVLRLPGVFAGGVEPRGAARHLHVHRARRALRGRVSRGHDDHQHDLPPLRHAHDVHPQLRSALPAGPHLQQPRGHPRHPLHGEPPARPAAAAARHLRDAALRGVHPAGPRRVRGRRPGQFLDGRQPRGGVHPRGAGPRAERGRPVLHDDGARPAAAARALHEPQDRAPRGEPIGPRHQRAQRRDAGAHRRRGQAHDHQLGHPRRELRRRRRPARALRLGGPEHAAQGLLLPLEELPVAVDVAGRAHAAVGRPLRPRLGDAGELLVHAQHLARGPAWLRRLLRARALPGPLRLHPPGPLPQPHHGRPRRRPRRGLRAARRERIAAEPHAAPARGRPPRPAQSHPGARVRRQWLQRLRQRQRRARVLRRRVRRDRRGRVPAARYGGGEDVPPPGPGLRRRP